MKKHTPVVAAITTLGIIVLGSSCSTFSSKKSGEDIATSGPTILTAKADPSTIDLDQNLNPVEQAMVYADVKDFESNVKQVHLRFIHVPLDIPMTRSMGTTWQAMISPAQLKELAVSGQIMQYQANVIATNENGQTAVGPSPVDIAIRTPSPKQLGGTAARNSSNDSSIYNSNQNDENSNAFQRNKNKKDQSSEATHSNQQQPGVNGSDPSNSQE